MHKTAILRWSLTATLVVVFLLTGSRPDAQTVLNFEDIAAGTTITTQFAARGVLFPKAFLESDQNAHSGTRVVRAIIPGEEPFDVKPLVINFTSAQARVKLFAGSQFAALNGTLTAFDSGGNMVATDGPRLVPQNTFSTSFQVTTASPTISRVEFQLEGSSFASIDDLEFEGQPTPTAPTQPPVVQLSQPVNGINVDIPGDLPRLDIAGSVTGDGLLPQVTVTVSYMRPPESAALPPLTLVLDLTGTGPTRQFTLPGGITPLPLGPIIVTATAENIGALKGTATSTLTNLPLAVRNRFGTDGGNATYAGPSAAAAAARSPLEAMSLANGCRCAAHSTRQDGLAAPRMKKGTRRSGAPVRSRLSVGASTRDCPEPRPQPPFMCRPCSWMPSTNAEAMRVSACRWPIPQIHQGRCGLGCFSDSHAGLPSTGCPCCRQRWRFAERLPSCGCSDRREPGSTTPAASSRERSAGTT